MSNKQRTNCFPPFFFVYLVYFTKRRRKTKQLAVTKCGNWLIGVIAGPRGNTSLITLEVYRVLGTQLVGNEQKNKSLRQRWGNGKWRKCCYSRQLNILIYQWAVQHFLNLYKDSCAIQTHNNLKKASSHPFTLYAHFLLHSGLQAMQYNATKEQWKMFLYFVQNK